MGGYGPKAACRIMTVDPATRRIEGALRDGAMVQIKAVEVSTVFRWPLEGEIWLIRQDDGYWVLDSRMENPQDGLGDITELNPGDTKITGNTRIAGDLTVDGAISSKDGAVASGPNSVSNDMLASTLAAQLGVSQTGTDRSVSVTQTAEITTTNSSGVGDTIVTSSELTTPANGLLQIVFFAEAKSSQASPSAQAYVFPLLNDAGTFRGLSPTGSTIYFTSVYTIGDTSSASVTGTTYKKIAGLVTVPFVRGGIESSPGKSQFRLGLLSYSSSYTAYVRNVTATMTYIAV